MGTYGSVGAWRTREALEEAVVCAQFLFIVVQTSCGSSKADVDDGVDDVITSFL